MKKINLKKKDAIYISIISVLIVTVIILSVLLFFANQRKQLSSSQEYYKNKVASFEIQNFNLSDGQIVFIGDSITDLYPLDSYYADLHLACYNRGIAGDVTQGVIDRLDVSVFDISPSKIVLMIGTNDIGGGISNEKIIENYRIILDKIKENQISAELYFVSVIPQNKDLESYTDLNVDKNNQAILKINAKIKELCQEYGCTYIDLHSLLLDESGYLKKECSDDGIHLNGLGFDIWTSILKPYLAK
jgi:lysophospholipase L1-like esterase